MKKKKRQEIPVSNDRHNRTIYLLFLVIVPLVLYLKVVEFGFSGLDDAFIISSINNTEGSKINLLGAFTNDALMSDKGNTFYRPMQIISLMVDAELEGSEPWVYHLTNLILHIFVVIALFFLLIKAGIKENISFLLSLLFAVNPMFTNAVTWIPARGDLLLCLFSLLSFITFVEYLESGKKVYLIIYGIVFAGAIFSKETAILLPVLILLYFYFIKNRIFQKKEISPFIIIWLATFIIFFTLRQSVLKESSSSNEFGIIPLIKNLPTIPITFCKFIIPYNLSTMPMFENIGLLAGICLLLVFAGIILKVVPVDRRGIISWGGIWFLAFSIPPMLFRSPIADFGVEYYEYRTYLPMIGILFILGFLLRELTSYISFKKIIIISVPILLIYSIIAYMHMTDFSDPISFFTSAINSSSKNAFAFAQRGEEYFNKGDLEGALLDFDNSIRISPNYSRAYFHKGALYNSMKDPIHAEQLFSVALNYDTLYPQINSLQEYAYFNLSSVKLNLKKFEEAIILLKKGVNKYQGNGSLHINLGLAYYNIAKYDSALYEYDKGINLEPNISSYYNSRGLTKYHLNDYKGAINDFNRALDLNPDFLLAWGNRGRTKIDLKDYEGAINDLTKAISIKRDLATVWYLRGLAFSKLNKQVEAESDWAEARKFGFKDFVDENQKQK